MFLWMILVAVGLDLLIGDPTFRWHPVRIVGRCIEWIERSLRKLGMDGVGGGATLVVAALGICGLPVCILFSFDLPPVFKFIAGVLTLYFSIALGSLLRESSQIRAALENDRLDEARKGAANLCGREVERLDGAGIIRATVESLAENSVDGFTAPLFYAAFFGPAGAWMYRIANTLDSMVGYKNKKYIRFGWAAARLDDLLNFVPARLTAILMSLSSPVSRGRISAGLWTMWNFAGLHPSPNAGWTESVAAGALGIRLGGPAVYFGKEVDKPWLGEDIRPASPQDIRLTSRLVLFTCLCFVALICVSIRMFST